MVYRRCIRTHVSHILSPPFASRNWIFGKVGWRFFGWIDIFKTVSETAKKELFPAIGDSDVWTASARELDFKESFTWFVVVQDSIGHSTESSQGRA